MFTDSVDSFNRNKIARCGISHLPVPRFSTASTSASTSVTENGLLVLRCESSDLLLSLLFTGIAESASGLSGVIGTIVLVSVSISFVNASGRSDLLASLHSYLLSKLIGTGGSSKEPTSMMGLAGQLIIAQHTS